jgi:hypothetical protein
MRRLREWVLRFGGLFDKQRKDQELASHLQMHIEDNLQLDMPPDSARNLAQVTFPISLMLGLNGNRN